MRDAVNRHVEDDLLEQYALTTLPLRYSASVEEHLLVCEHCCSRLAEHDKFIQSIRTALLSSQPGPLTFAAGVH